MGGYMKKVFFVCVLVCLASCSVFSMPKQYNDDKDGWFGIYIFYSHPLKGSIPSWGLGIRGAGPEDIGIDFQFIGGGITGISCGATYYYNPAGSYFYTLPLTASLGFFLSNKGGFGSSTGWDDKDSGVGLELSAGADLYALGGVYDKKADESSYIEIGARAAAYVFGRGLHLAAEGIAGGSMSITPSTDDNYTYVYY